jgi:multidrug resistance efflux pump
VLAPESGRLASVNVATGQRVSAGDEIGVVEVPGLAQDLAAAQAELMGIQANDADAASLARRFAKDVDAAQARWLSARVALESQRATLVGLDLELSRLESPGAAVPAVEVEARRATRAALKTEIDARVEEVGSLERAWVKARQRAGEGGDPALEARVQAAEAHVEAVRARVEACVLRAQASGTVTSAVPAAGTWMQAGFPAVTLTEATTEEAVVYLSPAVARDLEQGDELALLAATGERIDARVASIGPALEAVPLRQMRDSTVPEWGIPVTLSVAGAVLTPGEAFGVEF